MHGSSWIVVHDGTARVRIPGNASVWLALLVSALDAEASNYPQSNSKPCASDVATRKDERRMNNLNNVSAEKGSETVVGSGAMNAKDVSKESVIASLVPSLPAFCKRSIPKLPASPPGQETPMEVLLGPKLYKQGTLSIATTCSACADQELVMLYFAAAWRRECKEFNSLLLEFYKQCAVQEKIECVYVSSDRNLQEFKAFFATLPYFSMPTQTAALKNSMARNLKIVDMPTVIVLDPTSGLVVTTSGVADIENLGNCDHAQCLALARKWKACRTPIPFHEVVGDTRLKHGTIDRGFLYWHE